MATIRPNYEFDEGAAEAAAGALKDAMDGLGTNEEVIVKVMTDHSGRQRQEIADYYKTAYGQDLIEDLKSEIGGDFEQTVVAMLAPPRVYDARELHRAISGGGTDESCLIEILVSRSNAEIAEIKELYTAEFESNLEEDLDADTGGNFQRLLVSLVNGNREEDDPVDEEKAMQDAQNIFDAGEGQCGTDETEFNKVLCLRSRRQLYAMFDAYASIAGKSIEEVIQSETTGTLEEGYMAIVKHCRDPHAYFAECLHTALSGAGTTDDTLIRVIVSRSEVDLKYIKNSYSAMYDKALEEAVEGDCGGDYKRLLLAIIRGGADWE